MQVDAEPHQWRRGTIELDIQGRGGLLFAGYGIFGDPLLFDLSRPVDIADKPEFAHEGNAPDEQIVGPGGGPIAGLRSVVHEPSDAKRPLPPRPATHMVQKRLSVRITDRRRAAVHLGAGRRCHEVIEHAPAREVVAIQAADGRGMQHALGRRFRCFTGGGIHWQRTVLVPHGEARRIQSLVVLRHDQGVHGREPGRLREVVGGIEMHGTARPAGTGNGTRLRGEGGDKRQ